jgi:branched-chain amino acid aminotransferase
MTPVTTYTYLNDRLVPSDEAAIPASDWGFLYGDSLFETLRIHRGEPVLWIPHVKRLTQSAAALGFPPAPHSDDLLAGLYATLEANGQTDAVARITFTRGRGTAGLDPRQTIDPTLLITTRPYAPQPEHWLSDGLRLQTVRVPVREGWLRYRTKHGNYTDQLTALGSALDSRADEALLVDRKNRALEGARSNLFIVRRGTVITPPTSVGILPGVMRAYVIRQLRSVGLPVRCEIIGARSGVSCDEAFMTNSVWGVMPVATINGEPVGDGRPGTRTQEAITLSNERLVR